MTAGDKSNYAFIDGENLYKGALSAGWRIDYFRFRNYLATKYSVTSAYIFIGFLERNKGLYQYLERAKFELVFKDVTEVFEDGKTTVKGNVDADLVLHTMIEMDNYDKAIIVSNDGDFKGLVAHLISRGKLLKIMTPNDDYSHLLSEFASYIVNLSNIRHKIMEMSP